MSDITLTYGSTGFEKVQTEIEKLHDYSGKVPSWFQSANRTLEEHATQGTNAFRKINTAIQDTSSNVLGFIGHIARLGAVVGTVQGIIGGLGVYAFERWTKSVLMATDSQKQLESSLLGVVRSQGAVNKIMEFAKGYAAESPIATYHEVLEAMRELAYQPAIKPIMEEGDVDMMKRLMNVVQGLATMKPQEGIQGATYALRQALSGVWRTMQYQFAIRPEQIAGAAGISMEEMELAPSKAFKALETYVLKNTQLTTSLTAVINKLRASYREWLEDLGKTGIFDKVLGYLTQLNQFFGRIGQSEQWKGVTRGINAFLEGIANGIANIFTKGIDWEKVTDLSGALSAFKKVGGNTIEELGKAWEENKDWLTSTLDKILNFTATSMVGVAKKVFPPVGKAIVEAIKKGAEEHPFWAALTGAAIGFKLGGVPGMIAGAAAPFAPTLYEAAKDLDFRGAIFGRKPFSFKAEEWKGEKPFAGQGPEIGSDALMLKALIRPKEVSEEWYPETLAALGGKTIDEKLKEKIELRLGATQQFGIYSMWSKMGEQFAQRPEYLQTPLEKMTELNLEYRGMREKWDLGQISKEEWTKYYKGYESEYYKVPRMMDFRSLQMKKLEEIEAMPEATQIKPQVYEQMFGISMGRGEYGKAEGFLQKIVDAMKEAIKDKADFEKSIKEGVLSQKDTAKNTARTVEILGDILGQGAEPSKNPVQPFVESKSGAGGEQPWSEDELQRQTRNALGPGF